MKRWVKALKETMKWLAGIGCLVLITAYLAGAFSEKIMPGIVARSEEAPPGEFTTADVVLRHEPLLERVPGTVAAKHQISVSSRILARIEDVLVRSGDVIREGSPLVTLDSRDLVARESQSREQLVSAEAQLDEAQKEYERVQALYKENAVSLSKLDQAERGYRVASAQVDSAKQALEETRVSQTYAKILSPLSGRVVNRLAEPGDTAIPGQALLKVYDPSVLRLETFVRESLATRLHRNDPLDVAIDALGQSLKGRVEEIVPQAEPGSRSFLVKVGLPLDDRIYPGMFGRVVIHTGTAENLYIPEQAVHSVGQLDFVTLLKEGKPAGKQMVQLGNRNHEGFVQVLAGLREGDQVAVAVTH
jgi:RND family efflux transporter MFP subunit